jgi:hypothetical protein
MELATPFDDEFAHQDRGGGCGNTHSLMREHRPRLSFVIRHQPDNFRRDDR